MSVNADAVISFASSGGRLLGDSKTIPIVYGGTFRVVKNVVSYTYGRLILLGLYTNGLDGLLDEAGGKHHSITEEGQTS